ncbi:hypothetical protein Kfla_4331 [Kribbella flavida DSM 17836]|uniref:Uncharacterized protein n=1 Tax=Kribbella flavida (strain DSM 17836 / JCM 10339 / NBRC 14399) TaxID=479435 RepID=D2PV84_KRIFD|nr:hypothetical protein [Kribbella flavida]ADB33365.1 hypothetical protein Kfla_4331 [Kribbella flavida DSM 17836]
MKCSFLRRLLAVALPLAAVLVPAGSAAADDPMCSLPSVGDVYAYQQAPEASVLTGRVTPKAGCPSTGILTAVRSGEQIFFGDAMFEVPLGTQSGDWYLSSFTVHDVASGTSQTRTFQPVAPYLLRVLDQTRITSTAPASYVGYGDLVTVSGYLEGWTAADGWRRMPGRDLSITTGNGVDGHPNVPTVTDASGAYRLDVRIYNSFAGSVVFAGDERWLGSSGFNDAQVHGLVSVSVSDRTPAVGQRVVVTGKVAPGAVPVWVERRVGTQWVKVTATVAAGADGRYRLTYRPDTRGVQQLRVWNDGTEPQSRMGVQPYVKEFELAVHR